MSAVRSVVCGTVLAGMVAGFLSIGFPASVVAQSALNPPLLSEVRVFLGVHQEFGKPSSTQSVPDWAEGTRQRVTFDSRRSLLFYTKEGRVVTVYEEVAGAGRKIVWGATEQYVASTLPARTAVAGLPAYKVLFSVQKFGGGGRLGEVLVASLSRTTPAKTREEIARQIASKEGFTEVSLYSTKDSYKANSSEAFSKAHPGAMKRGFLGMIQDRKFVPGEALYP